MRVLPGVVLVVAALGLAGSLTGCAQFNKALGQQQALVSFKSGTPVSVRLQVRAACDLLEKFAVPVLGVVITGSKGDAYPDSTYSQYAGAQAV